MFAWLSQPLKSSLFCSTLIVLDASVFARARPCAASCFEPLNWTLGAFNFPFAAISKIQSLGIEPARKEPIESCLSVIRRWE